MNCLQCERPVHDAYLCPGDARALDENLAALGPLYEALAQFRSPVRNWGAGSAAVMAVEAPLPLPEPVLSLRGPGGLVQVVEDWLSALHCDLEWSQPRVYGTYEERLGRAVDGLRVNVLWIASSWPTAGVLAGEVRDLVKAVRSITDPPEPMYRVGPCPALTAAGTACGAILRVAKTGATTITCAWCSSVYLPSDWWRLEGGREAS